MEDNRCYRWGDFDVVYLNNQFVQVIMKVGRKAPNTIVYKKTNAVNPEINQAPCNIKPLVVKEQVMESNASMMAVIEQQRAEAAHREKQERIRNFQESVKLNATRISEQKSQDSISLKRQKQGVQQKQREIRSQYTRVHGKREEDAIRRIDVKPDVIEEEEGDGQQVQPMQRQPSVKAVRQRSKSPLSPLGIEKAEIAIPKYMDASSSESEDYIDSDCEGQDTEAVLRNYMQVRSSMSTKLQ